MSAAPKRHRADDHLLLLCPKCHKRLPLSGRVSMSGTTGVFCRGCRRTVQVSIDVREEEASPTEAQE